MSFARKLERSGTYLVYCRSCRMPKRSFTNKEGQFLKACTFRTCNKIKKDIK